MGADQSHAPRERVTATARDAAAHEGVEHGALLHPQPGHHRDAEGREEHPLAAALRAPRHLAAEVVLRLVGDADALVACVLPEAVDPSRTGGGLRRGRRAPGELDVGERAHDQDLLAVRGDLRRAGEPLIRQAASEPARQLLGCLVRCFHTYNITRGRITNRKPLQRRGSGVRLPAREELHMTRSDTPSQPSRRSSRTAIVTGASRGLGLALSRALAARGWWLVLDARAATDLDAAARELARHTVVRSIPGDVADPIHRRALVSAAADLGRLDLLVNNASVLGPSPQPALAAYPLDVLEDVYRVNVLAPLALTQLALPLLRDSRGQIVNITSDASVEAYEGWGGYGSSKAALDQLTSVLGVEEPELGVYAVDPGDMNTRLHQEAFPGEDVSDRPAPEASVPGLLELIDGELPSGRYRVRDLVASAV